LITVCLFRPNGKVEKIKPEEIKKYVKSKKNTLWVDLEQPTEEDYNFILKETFNFHLLSIEDCKRPLELPKVDVFDEHLFIVFHNVSSESQKGYFKKSEVDFFLGENFVVSVHLHKSKTIEYLIDRLFDTRTTSKKKKKKKLVQRTSDFVLYEILDNFIDRYFPLIDTWEEEIEDLEISIMRNRAPRHLLNRLLSIKRELLNMRKSIVPQREVIKKLVSVDFPFIRRKSSFYFKDVYDHISRVYSELEIQRDMINSAFEAHSSMVSNQVNSISNQTNKVMQKLTIMTAIFMPLTFITGLYGMNFEFLPGAHHPVGFFIVLFLSALTSLIMIHYFKKYKWL
jgi:magnesium transporter